MSILTDYLDGMRRVGRAPWVWLGCWLATLLVGLPLAIVLRAMIRTHLGDSLVAATMTVGANWSWWQEFSHQASGIGASFVPSVLGFAAVLRNLSNLLDNREMTPVVAGAVGAWLVLWSFLSGGVLDRFARNRATYASGFFAACGTHFFRFLRLGAAALPVYAFLFVFLHSWLHERLWSRLVIDLASERRGAVIAILLYAAFGLMLVLVSLGFDYARIRIVVEDRRSALAAAGAGFRFVRRHLAAVGALFAVNSAGFLVLAAIYALVAVEAWHDGPRLWLALGTGQAWILARLWVKLTFYASAVSLFQRHLAHADYVATSVADWPESPAAEALRGEPPVLTAP